MNSWRGYTNNGEPFKWFNLMLLDNKVDVIHFSVYIHTVYVIELTYFLYINRNVESMLMFQPVSLMTWSPNWLLETFTYSRILLLRSTNQLTNLDAFTKIFRLYSLTIPKQYIWRRQMYLLSMLCLISMICLI